MIVQHLRGNKEDCSDVLGTYPLFPDNTCRSLVFDFDNHEKDSYKNDNANTDDMWKNEVVALPLQGRALKQGNSAFVDEVWNAYPDQWQKLRSVRRLSAEDLSTLLQSNYYNLRTISLWSEDTCPSLGTLTINAMAAADEVIMTVNPQLLAMMGLQDFLKTVNKIRNRINDKLEVAGILLTMCDARTVQCRTITEQVQETFEGQMRIFKTKIPNTVKVGESVYYSEPLIEYAPGSNAGRAFSGRPGTVPPAF